MNMHHHSFGVDVGNVEIESLLQPESKCVDDGEKAQHGWLFNELKKGVDFADSNHYRQFEFAANSQEFESGPRLWASNSEEFFQTLLSDVDRACFPMQIVFDIQQVASQIVFGGGVWLSFQELGEFADSSAVGFLRTLFEIVKLKVLFEANEDWGQRLFVFGHNETP